MLDAGNCLIKTFQSDWGLTERATGFVSIWLGLEQPAIRKLRRIRLLVLYTELKIELFCPFLSSFVFETSINVYGKSLSQLNQRFLQLNFHEGRPLIAWFRVFTSINKTWDWYKAHTCSCNHDVSTGMCNGAQRALCALGTRLRFQEVVGVGDWDRKPNSNNFEHPHYF